MLFLQNRLKKKPQPSSALRYHSSLMASSDPTGLYIFGFIILMIIGLFAYSYLNNRRIANKHKELIRAFRAFPKFVKGAPVVVQGQALAPDLLLPTTGEHVAFYGLFVMSRETAITGTHSGAGVRVNGIALETDQTRIDSIKGFTFFESSGDFTVASGGAYYFVRASGVFAYFRKGMDMVLSLVAGQYKKAGVPDNVVEDHMYFVLAEQVLKMLCGFEAPLVQEHSQRHSGSWTTTTTTGRTTLSVLTATSRIDSRVQQYMAGYNLPQGVLDLITKRGITLAEKDEIIVIETFIPLNKEVFVFGTFDGDKSIVYADGTVQLSVSYQDPERE
jgi:hypothetical protein